MAIIMIIIIYYYYRYYQYYYYHFYYNRHYHRHHHCHSYHSHHDHHYNFFLEFIFEQKLLPAYFDTNNAFSRAQGPVMKGRGGHTIYFFLGGEQYREGSVVANIIYSRTIER